MKRIKKLSVLIFVACFFYGAIPHAAAWGFYAHRLINKMAVYTLPDEMIGFFKRNIEYLAEHSVDPDKRSRGVVGEAEKHYIDIDHYGPNPFEVVPARWKDAVAQFGEDTLKAHGINPWWIEKMAWKLIQAFKDENASLILYYAANFGHYIADATVPLHTTHYYDGKIPEHKGIHGFWETRIPELFAGQFNYFVGKAVFIENIQQKAWELVRLSHEQVDTLFNVFDFLRENFPADKTYVMEYRGNIMKKQFSPEYSREFEMRTNNMVERNLKRAIHAVGSFWYTCWVKAGQPDLNKLLIKKFAKEQKKEMRQTEKMWRTGKPVGRPNPEESGK